MTPESEDFTRLRTLLSLKRHEQPPPGYFNHFSSKIIARIEAQQAAALPWWQRAWAGFELKPALAVVGCVTVGGVVIGALTLPDDGGGEFAGVPHLAPPSLASHPTAAVPPAPTVAAGIQYAIRPLASDTGGSSSAVAPVINPPESAPSGLFREDGLLGFPSVRAPQPVGLQFELR